MTLVIETKNLSKKYKDQYALKDCSISVEKGDIYGIVGKNGAGKSTLLKLISGISLPTSGDLKIFGKDNLGTQRKRMAAIVENPTLFGDLSARENLEYFRIQRGIPGKEKIDQVLDLVGLGDVGKKQVKKFSVGMKQRLALGLALMSNPEILILDEPTSGIDPAGIVQIRKLLQKLSRENGVTILISSHILAELANLATKIAIIDKGQIKEELSLEDLYQKASDYVEIKTDQVEKTVAILEENFKIKSFEVQPEGEIRILDKVDHIDPIVKKLVEENIAVSKVIREHKSLEDYYIDLTGEN
ncbi:MAG: ABC transporter ATP-binding protein [Bacillota bacterium]|nr:ABC transporter ATP-binding protein [Bacillota bacterium]